ncbi:MAG: nucleoside triphosphate pyrophosphohydrolase [Coriobacteriales bacterium]|nr:nucleoside triphosphate pyrophosphohydrolase [Coriobacteriales bacterium]
MSDEHRESKIDRQIGERFETFVGTIERLRSPGGCPWDREQTHASIARNMAEEAYEAIDAIERDDMLDLREELGDVLLQVVLQSQMASEAGVFTIADVLADVNDKMIRRHPHVFGDEAAFVAARLSPHQIERIKATKTPGEVLDLWDEIKLIEKQRKASRKGGQGEGLLDAVPQALPALMQAQDISRKAVSAGFEWPDVASVWEQVASEIEEYRAEPRGSAAAADEFGDVLFSLVNVARKEGIDAESALRSTCRKFRERWAIMEQCALTAEKHISEYTVDELEELWKIAKEREEAAN